MNVNVINADGLAWDNTQEFDSLGSDELTMELERIAQLMDEAERHIAELSSERGQESARTLAALENAIIGPLEGLLYLAYIEIAVDSTCTLAHELASDVEALRARMKPISSALDAWLVTASPEACELIARADPSGHMRAAIPWRRALRGALASGPLESMEALAPHGPLAFERLYKTLVGGLRCSLKDDNTSRVGIAEARAQLQKPQRAVREAAWHAINNAWKPHRQSAAVALNAMVGWWHHTNDQRYPDAVDSPMHVPLLQSRMRSPTYLGMRNAIEGSRPLIQRVLELMKRALEVDQLAPWDLSAAPPSWAGAPSTIALGDGLAMMAEAFRSIVPSMGSYVETAVERGWIDARQGDNRRPGGLATLLWRSKSPRVFLNWHGTPVGARIAAHEMGHGFHFSHAAESFRRFEDYSWALLEIPSSFAELVMGQHLVCMAATPQLRFAYLWQEVLFAMKMLGITSAGLDLSLAIDRRRRAGWLSAEELDEMAVESWQHWLGTGVSPSNSSRWLSDHHLYLSSTRHTGFLYQFAWFSAMSLLGLQRTMGTSVFEDKYRSFLTHLHAGGVAELMQEHFDVDVSGPDLWTGGMALIEERVTELERSIAACGK